MTYHFKFRLSISVKFVHCHNHRNTKKIGIFNLFLQITKPFFNKLKIFVKVFRLKRCACNNFGSTTIPSTSGVQQGDPLGPFLFSLTQQPVLEKLQEIEGMENDWGRIRRRRPGRRVVG